MMRTLLLFFLLVSTLFTMAQSSYLLVGTYTGRGSKGIYVYRFNAATGEAEWVSNTDTVVNPSYLAIASGQPVVYAVNETHGNNPGKVSAFAFDKEKGRLRFINQQLSGGDDPCYVSVDKNNKWVLVGNYSGGNLSVLPVGQNGALGPAAQTIQHEGKSINKDRQEKAHVHAAVFSPDEHFLFTPDLGMDKVMVYAFDATAQKPLKPHMPSFAESEPGSGPRHFTFHPNGKVAYVIEELSGTVAAYQYIDGKLWFLQRISTHEKDYKGRMGSADIHVSPDGKFLYASNRGDANNIAIFEINQTTGLLTSIGYQPVLGKTPRNFLIHPSGQYLLVANQESDNIVIFKRDPQTGLLHATGKEIKVSMPVCLKWIP
jgi:6-phosphogluconolactonase